VSKRRFVSLVITAALLLTLPLLAQDGSKDQILGTAHDFVSGAGAITLPTDGNNQVCVFCHIPHEALGQSQVLLWNHQFGPTTTYTPYASATLDATVTHFR
jgi:hypothetical protein